MLWISSLIIAVVLALIINAALRSIVTNEPKVQPNNSVTSHEKLTKAYQSATMTYVSLQPSDFEPVDAENSRNRKYTNTFFDEMYKGFLAFYLIILFVRLTCHFILQGN